MVGAIKISNNILTSFFDRSQFCFNLNPLVVVEVNVFSYEETCILIGLELRFVNALCFENREEVFAKALLQGLDNVMEIIKQSFDTRWTK